LASSASVLSEEEMDAGVALVDIGGGTTDVAIFKDGIIRHTGVFGYGGNIITEDIKEGLGVMTKHAEMLKVKFGCAMAGSVDRGQNVTIKGMKWAPATEVSLYNLSLIIQARMEDIIGSVKSQIINAGFDNKKLIAGVVLTGGGSQLQYLKQLFEYHIGINTRIGQPLEYIANSDLNIYANPSYSTGIGLVRKGFEDTDRSPFQNLQVSEAQQLQEENTRIAEELEAARRLEILTAQTITIEEPVKKGGLGLFGRFNQLTKRIFEEEEDTNL
jgi:cell division protein FtsA